MATTFLEQAIARTDVRPRLVTTDKAPAYPPALWAVVPEAEHITGKAEQQAIERDHQHLKGRTRSMRGFQQLEGPFDGVSRIEFDRSSKYVAVIGFYGHGVYVWDVETGERYRQDVFNEKLPPMWSMRFNPTKDYLALGTITSYVTLENLSDGEQILADKLHTKRVYDADFTPDGNSLISAGEDHQIYVRQL